MFKVTLQDVAPAGLAPPDIAWSGFVGDFAPAPVGGLRASDPIASAVIMLLFTDAACAPDELRFEHDGDRRGWVGDAFGVDEARGEQPLGSTLWLLRRSALTEAIARRAAEEAERALQPLVAQGIAARVAASARIAGAFDRLELTVDLIRRDGRPVFSDRFDLVWKVT